MKQTTKFVTIVILVAVSTVLLPARASAQGQSGCRPFQALAQATLPSSTPLGLSKDVWGGPLYGTLGEEFVFGVLSGHDGVRESNANIGQKRDGSYTVGFNCQLKADGKYACQDTFTYEVANAVYAQPPGFGRYIGNASKILSGTGRFRFATGNLNVNGPFMAWADATSPLKSSGRCNLELSGFVCGIE